MARDRAIRRIEMQRHKIALAVCLCVVLTLCSSAAMAQYQLTNLVSNQTGKARFDDPLLVNAWGLAYGPGGPFWISDQGSGWSTLYNGAGVKQGLDVLIPSAGGQGPGSPTGIVFNGSQDFQVLGWASIFLFATLDGTISGWAPQSNPNQAIIAVTTPGAVYTGLAITSKTSGNFLYAADNANNKVDVYDASFNLVSSLVDNTIPAGFAPFGIQDINGIVYVAYASSSGASGGYIDMFTEGGTLIKTLAQGAPLNQPWGIAVAPNNFGPLSNALLVSNNTNGGAIVAFNAVTGKSIGGIKDTNGNIVRINQLWGIEFGGGTANDGPANALFFTAGPANNLAGTFGVIKLP
jgi:uncharacterized protein (TIGR03118 family)